MLITPLPPRDPSDTQVAISHTFEKVLREALDLYTNCSLTGVKKKVEIRRLTSLSDRMTPETMVSMLYKIDFLPGQFECATELIISAIAGEYRRRMTGERYSRSTSNTIEENEEILQRLKGAIRIIKGPEAEQRLTEIIPTRLRERFGLTKTDRKDTADVEKNFGEVMHR